ncbi:ubiquinone biosynthesis hydroxylase%2C UbiH/UbiF/VisC/COQ6 family [Achromobacter xylosoxidans]|uniref:FAD-dependent oxidoreductase n=1 Tax=Alcaligenes xylosoxydans xylosoxydans TaxID=85698 RepID=UPI0006C61A79|nr:NAD(P)/FAD-dependent oxidoreductase [Achromobacter xylosoxidans]CUI77440.1 ubiquinone biosynthesis hydroxylase%2C UbiH/UbiF/VisC/COQ6 family [Achromobacter xylosoxidans]
MQNLHVSIIGAGLGGLCLAQGLARAGIDFDVYERDARTDSRVQGYRLRIDASGQAALVHCLPPDLYALFQHSCSPHDRPGAMLDAQLRPLPQRASATWRLDDADAPPDRSAHRQTLREILLAGLDGRVHFGHGCAGMDDGGPRLEGIRARPGTLVVAADGVHSALRRQHLPQAAPEDSGTVTIFGMAPAGSLAPDGLPPDLRDGAGVVFGAGYALVLDAMKLAALPALAQRLAPACALTAVPGYQYWAIIGERSALPGADDAAISASQRDDTATGARWQQAAQRLLAPVHPALAAMVAASDPRGIALKTVYQAPPLPQWTQAGLTFLGDAVHAMSPAGGLGANTALADAQSLATRLARVCKGLPLGQALRDYEADLRWRGDRAVQQSAEAAARITGRSRRKPR